MKNLTEEQWQKKLTPEQYRVLREKGTEAAFSGQYDNYFEAGSYVCAGCGAKLFVADNKYDAGCGWPSFDRPADQANIVEADDSSFGTKRTEVMCAKCGGHLGHVFPDGPKRTTGQRFCINSASLDFKKASLE